jgi:hypothetical protein
VRNKIDFVANKKPPSALWTGPEADTAEMKGGSIMSADDEAKIRRWEQYIEESRKEARFLSPEGQQELQAVIQSYEKLIAMARGRGDQA